MKLSQWKLLPVLVAALAVAAGLAIGSGTSTTSAVSFNPNAGSGSTFGPLNVDTTRCLGTFMGNTKDPADGGPLPGLFGYHIWGERVMPTCNPSPIGGRVGLATRTSFQDGSVLATPALYSWQTGLDYSNLAAGYTARLADLGGPDANYTIGTIKSDVDLFCNGILDQLDHTDIVLDAVPPWFTGGILGSTPWNLAHPPGGTPGANDHYEQVAYARADITSINLGGVDATPLPNAVTLSFFFMKPIWAGADPTALVSLVILGGDPNPPSHPALCIQSPQRATTHWGFIDDGGQAANPPLSGNLIHSAINPFELPASGQVYFWDMFIGGSDYRDGLSQVGPAGGIAQGNGNFNLDANGGSHILRNVHCRAITGSCPAVGTGPGELYHDQDADGLPDVVETRFGTLPHRNDTSNNGLTDFEELFFMTNPVVKDSDGDAAAAARTDAVDNCPLASNSTQTDTSGNGTGDACSSDRDGDGMVDGAETGGIVMVYANNPIIAAALGVSAINTYQCRSSESTIEALTPTLGPGGAAGVVAQVEIFTDPANPDTDNDGIVDGAECVMASAPGNSAATIGTTNSVRVLCGLTGPTLCANEPLGTANFPDISSTLTGGAIPGGFAYDIGPANASRPQLAHSGNDDNKDGHVCPGADCNTEDSDRDGLPNILELAERTTCVRVTFLGTSDPTTPDEGGYFPGGFKVVDPGPPVVTAPKTPGDQGSCVFGATVDNPQFMGYPGLHGSITANFNQQGQCVGVGSPLLGFPNALTYEPVGTVPAFPADQRGCDGAFYMAGLSPSIRNQDGDGLATIKSTASGFTGSVAAVANYGSNRIRGFAAAGIDGCTWHRENTIGLNDNNGRDFPDVDNNQLINIGDVSRIQAAFNASATQLAAGDIGFTEAGAGPGAGNQFTQYKRTLDVHPVTGRGNGIINIGDFSRAQLMFNETCRVGQSTP
jgi:hypothetical protein